MELDLDRPSSAIAQSPEDIEALQDKLLAFTEQHDPEKLKKKKKLIKDIGGHQKYLKFMMESEDYEIADKYAKHGLQYDGLSPKQQINNNKELLKKQNNSKYPYYSIEDSLRLISDCVYLFPGHDRGNHYPPSTTHELNIDNVGRPKSATQYFADLPFPSGGTPNADCQRRIRGWGGQFSTDDGGHLMAKRFHGYKRRANIVPMNSTLNQQPWNNLAEDGANLCVTAPNWYGVLKVDGLYATNSGADVRPFGFLMMVLGFNTEGTYNFAAFLYMPNEEPNPTAYIEATDFYLNLFDRCFLNAIPSP